MLIWIRKQLIVLGKKIVPVVCGSSKKEGIALVVILNISRDA
jgi:hypothetical protein